MKPFLLLIAVCFIYSISLCQDGASTKIINEELFDVENRFGQLNQAEITSGNLINRSFVFSNHASFYKDSISTNNYGGWQQLYLEVFNGYYNTSNQVSLDTLKSRIKQQKENDITPILIMDLEYQQLKSTAIEDSLIYEENGIYKDVLTRIENPYETKRIVSFAPATNSIYKNNYTFLVSKNFFFTNQTNDPQSIEIDFGDGNGYQVVNWETVYSVQ